MAELQLQLGALGSISGSALRLTGFVIVILSWTIIAWRTRRNRHLLQNLQKLPHKDRLAALQAEMGHVALKEGISPEQWLRSRIHLYLVIGAVIAIIAAVVVTAMFLFAKPRMPDVALSLLSERPSELDKMKSDQFIPYTTVTYKQEQTGDVLTITPEMPYLVDVKAGKYVKPLEKLEAVYFWDYYPELSVKLDNNVGRTIVVTGVEIKVEKATPNLDPLLFVVNDVNLGGKFNIYNAGWTPTRNARLAVGLNEDCKSKAADTGTLQFARIDDGVTADVTPFVGSVLRHKLTGPIASRMCLSENGYDDCTKFAKPVECATAEEGWCTSFTSASLPIVKAMKARLGAELAAFPVEMERPACVRGDLSYPLKSGATGHFRFMQDVYVGNPDLVGGGAPLAPSAHYNVMLDSTRSGYTIAVPVSHSLHDGEADHFVLKIGSDRSASYSLTVRINSASGVIKTQRVDLSFILPAFRGAPKSETPIKSFTEGDVRRESAPKFDNPDEMY